MGQMHQSAQEFLLKMILQCKEYTVFNAVIPCLLIILHVCVKNMLVLNMIRLVYTCGPNIPAISR
jgi:hypothetical protein